MDMITPNMFGNNSDGVNDDNDDDDDDADHSLSRFNDVIQQDLYNELVTSAGNYSDSVNVCIAAEEEVTKIEQFMDILGVLLDSYEFEDDPDELQEQQKHLQMLSDYEDNLVAAQEFLKTCQFNKKIALLKYDEAINAYNFYVNFKGKVHEELQQMAQTVMKDNIDDLPTLAECMGVNSNIVGVNSDQDIIETVVELDSNNSDAVEPGEPGDGQKEVNHDNGGQHQGRAGPVEVYVRDADELLITDVDKLIIYMNLRKDIRFTRFRKMEPSIVHWNFIYWVNMNVMSTDFNGNVYSCLIKYSSSNWPYDRGKCY